MDNEQGFVMSFFSFFYLCTTFIHYWVGLIEFNKQ